MNAMEEMHTATEQVGRLTEFGRQYIEEKVHLSKLEVAQKTAQVASEITSKIIAFVFSMVSLVFFECALTYLLYLSLDSLLLSLVIIGGLNVVFAILIVLFRKVLITNAILPYFIRLIFKNAGS